ncbi:DUF6671 family protein [Mucilaginibacter gossypii]|uniref:DUF6671 domain-containing protein n=1 Tax=Mucilaginibacter gossypii TaxID=551996 RepID=A0A1G7PYR4_9SPHI|nr:DUF6671 family protein [Mucilaginibacter gossypii]SDF91363.1 hypothetical protein SAMN05192573_101718 [Mucilaginibacter gossypii]
MNKRSAALFKGRKLVIATMHGKEKVIAPLLEKALGVEALLPEGFNTDRYGTFSGEIEREKDPLETARTKCLDACRMTGCTLAVASEGSFGAHPTIFFIPADDEIMVFMDLENDIYVRARVVSPKTNFGGSKFADWPDAVKFAHIAGFPAHGLILRGPQRSDTLKGIQSWEILETNFETHLKNYGEVFLETDMRAMYNPTRMQVIAEVAAKLVEIILRTCPRCQFPGFDVIEVKPGLQCSQCGLPTKKTLSHRYQCKKCLHSVLKLYPFGEETEDPQYCDYCNP